MPSPFTGWWVIRQTFLLNGSTNSELIKHCDSEEEAEAAVKELNQEVDSNFIYLHGYLDQVK